MGRLAEHDTTITGSGSLSQAENRDGNTSDNPRPPPNSSRASQQQQHGEGDRAAPKIPDNATSNSSRTGTASTSATSNNTATVHGSSGFAAPIAGRGTANHSLSNSMPSDVALPPPLPGAYSSVAAVPAAAIGRGGAFTLDDLESLGIAPPVALPPPPPPRAPAAPGAFRGSGFGVDQGPPTSGYPLQGRCPCAGQARGHHYGRKQSHATPRIHLF